MFKKLMDNFEKEFIGQTKIWYPVNDSIYCGRMSDKDIEDMQARNQKAIKDCIKKMGKKWVLHKSHMVTRL